MPEISRIKGVSGLLSKLKDLLAKAKGSDNVVIRVGYTARYALFVHENIEMKWKGKKRKGKRPDGSRLKGRYWDPQGRGRAKFLEEPARVMSATLGRDIALAMRNGATLKEALFIAGFRLQAASQKLVPVDSGNLKGSAFTGEEV